MGRKLVGRLERELFEGFDHTFSPLAFETAQDRTVLRIAGKITEVNTGEGAEFDLERLEKLGVTSFTTMTPWFDKPITFEGVLVRKVLAAVGARGRQIVAVGLNDYRSTLPVEDFENYDVILAYKREGSHMNIRDKGPLFIVYPFDSAAAKPGLRPPTGCGRCSAGPRAPVPAGPWAILSKSCTTVAWFRSATSISKTGAGS
ncbi:hypothetical protein MNBD_ALPHA09-1372 [hydrothermal vent metagenome]|uniref:Oxidoreductase molybdopterin-binding domain-containing protein n=1 Tax=hydrothermal vent metagenome TaxID=652676 RepID=A0A3B0TRM7_9ZZZZ